MSQAHILYDDHYCVTIVTDLTAIFKIAANKYLIFCIKHVWNVCFPLLIVSPNHLQSIQLKENPKAGRNSCHREIYSFNCQQFFRWNHTINVTIWWLVFVLHWNIAQLGILTLVSTLHLSLQSCSENHLLTIQITILFFSFTRTMCTVCAQMSTIGCIFHAVWKPLGEWEDICSVFLLHYWKYIALWDYCLDWQYGCSVIITNIGLGKNACENNRLHISRNILSRYMFNVILIK